MATDRVIQLLLERSSLDRRLELATMDSELCRDVLSFPNVSLAVINSEIILATKEQHLATASMSAGKMAHHFGRHLSNLVVETRLPAAEWKLVLPKLPQLKKLFLSVENLVELEKVPADLKVTDQLKSLHLLQDSNLTMDRGMYLVPAKIQNLLSPSLTRICLTGLILTEDAIRCLFSLPKLKSMDLIGTLVDTKMVRDLQHTLKPPSSLEELSLPASWFSFSTADSYGKKRSWINKDPTTFATWLTVPKLCLYVHIYEEKTFWNQLNQSMPKGLETLVLYGNHTAIKSAPAYEKWNKFKILFGPATAYLLTFTSCGSTRLLSHIIKKPPYSWSYTAKSWHFQAPSRGHESEESDVQTARAIRSRSGSQSRSRPSRRRDGRQPAEIVPAPVVRRIRRSSRRNSARARPQAQTPPADQPVPNPPTPHPRGRRRRSNRSGRRRASRRRASPRPPPSTTSSMSVQGGSSQRTLSSAREPPPPPPPPPQAN